MPAILGIDAAWTERGSSGVALLSGDSGGWTCIAAKASYAEFMREAGLGSERTCAGLLDTVPTSDALLAASEILLGGDKVDVVAVDMPMATVPISGRRAADNAISSEFGNSRCSTHTPSPSRPGELGRRLSGGFCELGYPLATSGTQAGETPAVIEVFPHVALLRMLNATRRVPYKVGKSRRYWSNDSLKVRKERILDELAKILAALAREISGVTLELPDHTEAKSLSCLKTFEDVIDAIVCAWVGMSYICKNARPYGDRTAAIWVPEPEN